MSPIFKYNGKILNIDGKLAANKNCCCDPCKFVVSISVIDEDTENPNRDGDWAAFRAAWPQRKFFLLRPVPTQFGNVTLPAGWDGTGPIEVGRPGDGGAVTDWYNVCDLDNNLLVNGKVSLFIDGSGSMDLNTVRDSYDLFLQRLANRVKNGNPDPVTVANGRLILVFDNSERWIFPHISFEGCP